uniref:cDNA FLJ38717 fis, clone KIDNE2009647 n=1 Tax=Homo sapiens TaxID=9606 RepID=Q8N8X8_HUMAN|nr:unnamed protein product [Homo sapiens]
MDPASGEGEGRGWGGRRRRRGLFFILASPFPPHLRAAAARRAGPGCGGESSGQASRPGPVPAPAPAPSPRRRRAPAAGLPLPSRLAAFSKHRRGSAAASGRAPSRAEDRRPSRASPARPALFAAPARRDVRLGRRIFGRVRAGVMLFAPPRVAPNAGYWVGGCGWKALRWRWAWPVARAGGAVARRAPSFSRRGRRPPRTSR